MIKKRNASNSKLIIVIVGPTASGKSDLALRLARLAQNKAFKKYGINGAEIVSADSRQVYRGLNIGTGKVKRDTLLDLKQYYSAGIRHHLLDVANPKKQFTASDFKKLGDKALSDIARRSKLPIIVGGTGFYIDILLGRMSAAPVPPNLKLRAQFDKLTPEKLFEKLQKLDPGRAEEIDRYNKRRLVRALEIVEAIGKIPPAPLQPSQNRIFWLGLRPNNLEMRIKKRLDERLGQKMIGEIKNLHKNGISWKRLDDLGLEYRQISRYLTNKKFKSAFGEKSLNNFVHSEYYRNLLRDIIRYSKRQMTWFKKNKEIRWVKNYKEAMIIVRKELL